MMKIGLFYGSSTCYTEMVSEKIQAQISANLTSMNITDHQINIYNVKETPLTFMAEYDFLILGISTWDFGEIQEDWFDVWEDIQTLSLKDKTVALFGLGDQDGYGEWFLDAMGLLHEQVKQVSANLIGYWPTEGYEFEASKALTPEGDHFVGLALDEDTQYELTDQRIQKWCNQILTQYYERFPASI